MHCDTGTLLVIECDATPSLNADSVLFQQVRGCKGGWGCVVVWM